jgi:hypothetical protein
MAQQRRRPFAPLLSGALREKGNGAGAAISRFPNGAPMAQRWQAMTTMPGGIAISTDLRGGNRGAVPFAVTPIFGGGYHAPERGIASPAAGFHQILTLPNGVKSCSSLRSKSRNPAVFWHRGKQPVVSNDTEPRVPGFLQILQDFSAEGRFLRRRKNSPNDPD